MAEQARHPQLDSLRAFSVMIVVFVHTMRPRGPVMGDFAPLAVALFFVLSGFLITGILLDARERAEAAQVGCRGVLWRFYVRRFLRIFPIYYGVIAVAILLGQEATRSYVRDLVLYQQNFLLGRVGHNIIPITPLWSLAVEEHFYVVWPVIALFGSRRVIWTASAIMVFGSLASRAWLQAHNATYQAMTMPTYTAVDAIALGCMLALLWRDMTAEKRQPLLRVALVVGGVLAVARLVLFIFPIWQSESVVRVLNTLPFALACMWLIDRGARDTLPSWLSNRWLAKLGLVSYAVYVVHRFVMHFMGYDYERGLHVFFPVLAVSTLIAIVSWMIFEGPINNLKRFFPYVKRVDPAPDTVPSIVEASEAVRPHLPPVDQTSAVSRGA